MRSQAEPGNEQRTIRVIRVGNGVSTIWCSTLHPRGNAVNRIVIAILSSS